MMELEWLLGGRTGRLRFRGKPTRTDHKVRSMRGSQQSHCGQDIDPIRRIKGRLLSLLVGFLQAKSEGDLPGHRTRNRGSFEFPFSDSPNEALVQQGVATRDDFHSLHSAIRLNRVLQPYLSLDPGSLGQGGITRDDKVVQDRLWRLCSRAPEQEDQYRQDDQQEKERSVRVEPETGTFSIPAEISAAPNHRQIVTRDRSQDEPGFACLIPHTRRERHSRLPGLVVCLIAAGTISAAASNGAVPPASNHESGGQTVREEPLAQGKAAISDPLDETTPDFPSHDEQQILRALDYARAILSHNDGPLVDLLVGSLQKPASSPEVSFFRDRFAETLRNLAPNQGVYDGRYSRHRLPRTDQTVEAYFRRRRENDHVSIDAFVTEVSFGRFVIFLGPGFFRLSLEQQAQVLLHETVHTLGGPFGDDAFLPFLRRFRWYEDRLSPAENLRIFFEKTFRPAGESL